MQNAKSGYDVDDIISKQERMLKNNSICYQRQASCLENYDYMGSTKHNPNYSFMGDSNYSKDASLLNDESLTKPLYTTANVKNNVVEIIQSRIQSKTSSPNKMFTNSRKSQTPIINRDNDNCFSNEDKMVLYKKGHEINGTNYIIEISKNLSNPDDQNITAYPVFSGDTLSLLIPEHKYGDVRKNPEEFAQKIMIRNNHLILVMPILRSKTKSCMRGPIKTITPTMGGWRKSQKMGSLSTNLITHDNHVFFYRKM